MAIPEQFIADLVGRIRIEDIVGSRVQLRKAGKEYKGLCPFHTEKTPSFTVQPTKGFYHCFGCGANGDAIKFLLEYDRLSFPEAVASLADTVGISVPNESGEFVDLRPLIAANEEAQGCFEAFLGEYEPAQKYLADRGITPAQAKTFGIGYAPPFYSFKDWKSKQDALVQAGLAHEDTGYPFFKNRITFPLKDNRGRIVGFSCRRIEEHGPKYINTPETPLFKKRELLFSSDGFGQVFVVEGVTDVVSMAEQGYWAAASCGTAVTPEHVRLLYRWTSDVIILMDGDKAGQEAIDKSLEAFVGQLTTGKTLSIAVLPEGEDPDSLSRKDGGKQLAEVVASSQSFSDYLFSRYKGSAEEKAVAAEMIGNLVGRMPNSSYKNELQRLMQGMGMKVGYQRKVAPQAMKLGTLTQEDKALAAALSLPELPLDVDLESDYLSPFAKKVFSCKKEYPKLSSMLTSWDEAETKPRLSLLSEVALNSEEPDEELFLEFYYSAMAAAAMATKSKEGWQAAMVFQAVLDNLRNN